MVEELATAFSRRGPAEYDDLRQEGMISVWRALAKGVTPSRQQVANAMKSWSRYVHRWDQEQQPLPEA